MSGQEKGNKKRHHNKNNKKGKKHACMVHRYNPAHSTKQCHTLKKEAKNAKKGRKNDNRKNKKGQV